MSEPAVDPFKDDRYFFARSEGKAQIGAYLPGAKDSLTIYWQGDLNIDKFCSLLESSEKLLQDVEGTIETKLIGYRSTDFMPEQRGADDGDRVEKVVPGNAHTLLKPSGIMRLFEAYRVELTGRGGKQMVLWANVTGERQRNGLDEGGENIGVSMPPQFFESTSRPMLVQNIAETTTMSRPAINSLLDQLVAALADKKPSLT